MNKEKILNSFREWYLQRKYLILQEEEEFFGTCEATREDTMCVTFIEEDENDQLAIWTISSVFAPGIINDDWSNLEYHYNVSDEWILTLKGSDVDLAGIQVDSDLELSYENQYDVE